MTQTASDLNGYSEYLEGVQERGRTMLLPALIEAQDRFGHISRETARQIGRALNVPLADVSGVIDFYSMLHDSPRGQTFLRVCTSPTCAAFGAQDLLESASRRIGLQPGQPDPEGNYFLEPVACLGLCDHAPAALVDGRQVGRATAELLLEPGGPEQLPSQIFAETRLLTERCGRIDPTSIEEYEATGGFEALRSALRQTPDEVIQAVKDSGLRGRGGAGFPAGLKWEGTAQAEGYPKYVVCNIDESEPGTFKDRALVEGDPLAVLEGILIAAHATGAHQGFLYIRGEYPRAYQVLHEAMEAARAAGYLGTGVLDSDLRFEVELRRGAGAYICGEETALFESIEGKRGFPRIKPPFPTTHGLFQKPTVINNVETFANVPLLYRLGVDDYRQYGSEAAPGPRLFSLSGAVEKPGVYELLEPTSVRELIFGHAGGVAGGRELGAVLLGGAAGKFVHPRSLDMVLSDEETKAAGHSLGSGAVMVFDEKQDLGEILSSLGHFFAHESCGKCYPCQLGSQRQAEILDRVHRGSPMPGDVDRLEDVGWTMTDASLCGLGQTAALAVLSAMELWPERVGEEKVG